MKESILTLGPCLFNWKLDDWIDFYYKIADESEVDEVYLGEVVCFKRYPFFKDHIEKVAQRLQKAGKKVHLSTLTLIVEENELRELQELLDKKDDYLIEANDFAALKSLVGKKHIIGPNINIYNESTLDIMVKNGATRVVLQCELDKNTISTLAAKNKAETEVMIFGRAPLAIATRCYHARIHGTGKKSCGYVCEKDYNGKVLKTLTGESFLSINGTQTMSNTYINLAQELKELQENNVNVFRLSPHYMDMIAIADTFKKVLQNKLDPNEANDKLLKILPENEKFSNGFYHGTVGKKQLSGTQINVE